MRGARTFWSPCVRALRGRAGPGEAVFYGLEGLRRTWNAGSGESSVAFERGVPGQVVTSATWEVWLGQGGRRRAPGAEAAGQGRGGEGKRQGEAGGERLGQS